MKYFCLAFLVAMAVYVQAGDEEVGKKFAEDIKQAAKKCLETNKVSDEDRTALKNFEIPPTQEGKCLAGCIFDGLGLFTGNKFEATTFKTKSQEWLKNDAAKQKRVEEMMDTCAKTVPENSDQCALAVSSMECLQKNEEETACFKKFLSAIFQS